MHKKEDAFGFCAQFFIKHIFIKHCYSISGTWPINWKLKCARLFIFERESVLDIDVMN